MTLFNEPLMIATAPDHILVGLGLFFAFAAVSLFCQAVEQGIYPEWRNLLSSQVRRAVRHREMRGRWVRYTLGQEWYALSA